MSKQSPDKNKVVDFAAAALRRGNNLPQRAPVAVQIKGNNNVGVAGDRNSININVKMPARKQVRVEIQRGPEHITEEQAAEIRELVSKVVKVSDKSFQFVWEQLKKKFRFASYRLLQGERFEEVRKYLRTWIASAGAPLAAATPPDTRKRLLARIHAEASKRYGLLDQVHAYIHGRFGTRSLGDLAPGQLHEVVKQFRL